MTTRDITSLSLSLTFLFFSFLLDIRVVVDLEIYLILMLVELIANHKSLVLLFLTGARTILVCISAALRIDYIISVTRELTKVANATLIQTSNLIGVKALLFSSSHVYGMIAIAFILQPLLVWLECLLAKSTVERLGLKKRLGGLAI